MGFASDTINHESQFLSVVKVSIFLRIYVLYNIKLLSLFTLNLSRVISRQKFSSYNMTIDGFLSFELRNEKKLRCVAYLSKLPIHF